MAHNQNGLKLVIVYVGINAAAMLADLSDMRLPRGPSGALMVRQFYDQ